MDDLHGYNAVLNNGDATDRNGHGTLVAGIIGADGHNNAGVTGVAWKIRLMSLASLDESGVGTVSEIVQSIDYAIAQGAQILNSSWSGAGPSDLLRQAITRAGEAGIVFVQAAGNNSANLDHSPSYPASFGLANVVTVGATGRGEDWLPLSAYGAGTVGIAAPGIEILSSAWASQGETGYLSGTSAAAPLVTGSLALMAQL